MSITQKLTRWTMMMGALLLSVGFAACGGGGGGGASIAEDTVPATFTASSSDVSPAPVSGFVTRGNVNSSTIESLVLEITKITVHKAAVEEEAEVVENEGDSESLDPDTEEAEGDSGWLTLFEANTPAENIVLDLINLQTISEVLTSVNLPVGKYTKIALYYENPVVTIGGVETSDIQTTANGRIFISQNFIVPDTGPVLIEIDFKDIGLADTNGSYVLNPQLRVDIEISSAEVEFDGVIVGITLVPESIAVDNGNAVVDVVVTAETVITKEVEVPIVGAVEPAPLFETVDVVVLFSELLVGDAVEVEGLLQLDQSIIADEIEVEEPEVVEPEVVEPVV